MDKSKVKMIERIFSLYGSALYVVNDPHKKKYNEKIIKIAELIVGLFNDEINHSDPIVQRALKMRYQDEMSYDDISTSLGYVNHSSSLRLIKRYFKDLAQALTEEGK